MPKDITGNAYRLEWCASLAKWWIIRRIDQLIVAEFNTRREAIQRFKELESL